MGKKQKLTPYQEEVFNVIKAITEYKKLSEANVCAILYKNPDLLRQSNLVLSDFSNNEWKVYFAIIYGVIITEKKNAIDEIIVGIYLEKHPKLREKYLEYGAFETIINAGEYVKEETFDSYVQDMKKWNAVLSIAKRGWVSKNKLSRYADMSAEEIYDEFQIYLNDIFANIEEEIKSYDANSDLRKLIDELDQGLKVGLPYSGMPILTHETGGQYRGSITLLGGLSNVGKSTLARNVTIPSIIDNNEKLVVLINEEGVDKWKRELIIYVCNNILNEDLQKHVLRDGNFSKETREVLNKAVDWIESKIADHTITLIPLPQYSTSLAIKLIKKYAALGVNYFILDTFKMDSGKVSDNSWLQMQQNMVAINDVVKPETNNLHILITFQLSKGSTRQRFYSQDNIGIAKNIVDVASTCLMVRTLYDDERPGESRALKIFKPMGNSGKSKQIIDHLDSDKNYQILFIAKNREGSNNYQIVVEHDLSRNTLKEVGYTRVPMDT